MRLGIDAHMVGEGETGNETYVRGLIAGLSTLEAPPELVCYHTVPPWLDASNISYRGVSSNPVVRLGVQLPYRTIVDNLDLLAVTYIAPIWSRCPTVVAVHDVSYITHPEWFSRRDRYMLNCLVPRSIRRSSAVLTLTETARREIIDRYRIREEKTHVVGCGPGPAARSLPPESATRAMEEIGVREGTPFLLFVGNLQPRKNLVRLLESFRIVSDELGSDLVLVVAGRQAFQGHWVSALATKIGSGRVLLSGYLDDLHLAAAYSRCEAFVMPSLHEGFGIPVIEAMWHGAPVLAAAAGALPEVCGDAAVYFDPLDVGEMAAAISRVVSDRNLRIRLRHAGKRRAELFTWTNVAARALRVAQALT